MASDHPVDRVAFCAIGGKIHSGEEERFGRSIQSAQPGSSHGMAPVASGVRGNLPHLAVLISICLPLGPT